MGRVILHIFLAVFLTALFACEREDDHPVPFVRVDFNFNVLHYNLSNPGMTAQLAREESGGYRGIFVYRMSVDEFRAFDRACPDNPHQCTLRISDENPLMVYAECCESEYLLIDGSVSQGPSNYPLREYRTSFNASSNRLTIVN